MPKADLALRLLRWADADGAVSAGGAEERLRLDDLALGPDAAA